MTMNLADRISKIKPSATMAVNAKATELRNQGLEIINLSVGEPDFDTPEYIREAAIKAINDGFTRYTGADGIPELKNAIIKKIKTDNQLDYEKNEIIVSTGAKQVIYNLCQVTLNDGDEVIIPAPYWVSYPDIAKLAGATPVIIETDLDANYKITAEQLEKAITSKTRMLFINSPSNPSGMAYNEDELRAIAEVLRKHPNVLIASDEIYEYILWGMKKYVNILNVCPELKERFILINGVSKSHAMTGWRIGYSAAPVDITTAMKKVQSQSTSCACSISQKAAAAALEGPRNAIDYMFKEYHDRHDFVFNALSNMPDVKVKRSDGTFYIFPDVRAVIKKLGLKDDVELANLLLEKAHVALVPGTAFGCPGHIRISFATSLTNLEKAMQAIAKTFTGA